MSCCGGGPRKARKYEVTTPQGDRLILLSEVEVRIALATHGGGTVRPLEDSGGETVPTR